MLYKLCVGGVAWILEGRNLIHSFSSSVRPVRQSVSPARRQEDQQEEDFHQEGRHEPHLQRSHDLLRAVPRPAGEASN